MKNDIYGETQRERKEQRHTEILLWRDAAVKELKLYPTTQTIFVSSKFV